MTTKVTVDAHAGWPVKVTTIDLNVDGSSLRSETVVPPNTTQDFYVHQQRELHIKEMPNG